MPRRQFWCPECKCWVVVEKDETVRGSLNAHKKLCAGDPFAGHPDLIELDAELEYFFGGDNGTA